MIQYAWVCVPNKVKNMNVKVFNLMSGAKETRFLLQHKSCECKCGWMTVYVIQQKWILDKCRSECKKLDDWSSCKDD